MKPASAMSRDFTTPIWGKVRIEALSDGVFAIALTLLVLDIRIPDLPRSVPSREALRAIQSLGPSFLSFLITFALGGSSTPRAVSSLRFSPSAALRRSGALRCRRWPATTRSFSGSSRRG
jgi:hypothetical protein